MEKKSRPQGQQGHTAEVAESAKIAGATTKPNTACCFHLVQKYQDPDLTENVLGMDLTFRKLGL